ncbi:MAG: META domain-containing protein [Euryarchaeota archaeon]|nr:META domain-containing protein [Euryarchaeota archaeon]
MVKKNNQKTGIPLLFGTAIVLAVCLICAGCISAPPDTDGNNQNESINETTEVPTLPTLPTLSGTEWQLISYDNGTKEMVSVIKGTEITLEFDQDGRITGSAGINRYFAPYEINDDKLSFGLIGSTLMAGPGPVMNQESTYLKLLNSTASFGAKEEEKLTFFDPDGKAILVFEKAQPPAQKPLAGTKWVLNSYNDGNEAIVSVIAGTEINLTFNEEGGISGSAGCNSYFSSYETDGDTLSFGLIGSTKMFCNEPNGIMEQEGTYLKLLESAAGCRIEGDHLTIQDSSDKTILTFIAEE